MGSLVHTVPAEVKELNFDRSLSLESQQDQAFDFSVADRRVKIVSSWTNVAVMEAAEIFSKIPLNIFAWGGMKLTIQV